MTFLTKNDYTTGRKPAVAPVGSEVVSVRFDLAITTANLADLALNTIGEIGELPAGCVPVGDVFFDMTDPDASTAALVLQVGIWDGSGASLSTATADGGAHWGVSQATTAAATQTMTKNGIAMASVQPIQSPRKIGLKVATAPTTAQACTIGVTVFYKSA